jgi:hypothetical protein
MPADPAGLNARRARFEQLFEEYRVAKQRRLLRRAMRRWRQAEADQQLVRLDAPTERVH